MVKRDRKQATVLTTSQKDVLDHLRQFGPTWPGCFHGTTVKALIKKGLAVLDDKERLAAK